MKMYVTITEHYDECGKHETRGFISGAIVGFLSGASVTIAALSILAVYLA